MDKWEELKRFIETAKKRDEYLFKEEADEDERFFPGRISAEILILAEMERLEGK